MPNVPYFQVSTYEGNILTKYFNEKLDLQSFEPFKLVTRYIYSITGEYRISLHMKDYLRNIISNFLYLK